MGKDRRGEEIQQREQETWRLRVSGLTQAQIAERLGVTQAAVSKILTRVSERLAVEFREEVFTQRVLQTEQLERVMLESMSAWRRSLNDDETVSVVTGRVSKEGGALPEQVTRTVHGQSGNPGLLAQYRGALADIRAIWGLEAPKKTDLTTGGQPVKAYLDYPDDDTPTDS